MKTLHILLLCLLPFAVSADVALRTEQGAPLSLAETIRPTINKPGVIKHFLKKQFEKKLLKKTRFLKNADGSGLALTGLVFGILGLLPYILYFEAGVYFSILLAMWSVIGIAFSIPGYFLARRWHDNKLIERIALAGIIANGLVILAFVAVWILYEAGVIVF